MLHLSHFIRSCDVICIIATYGSYGNVWIYQKEFKLVFFPPFQMQECVQFISACDKHDQQSWQLYVDGLPTYCDSLVGFFPNSHVDDYFSPGIIST